MDHSFNFRPVSFFITIFMMNAILMTRTALVFARAVGSRRKVQSSTFRSTHLRSAGKLDSRQFFGSIACLCPPHCPEAAGLLHQ